MSWRLRVHALLNLPERNGLLRNKRAKLQKPAREEDKGHPLGRRNDGVARLLPGERLHVSIAPRLLLPKLVAREGQNGEAARMERGVKVLEALRACRTKSEREVAIRARRSSGFRGLAGASNGEYAMKRTQCVKDNVAIYLISPMYS